MIHGTLLHSEGLAKEGCNAYKHRNCWSGWEVGVDCLPKAQFLDLQQTFLLPMTHIKPVKGHLGYKCFSKIVIYGRAAGMVRTRMAEDGSKYLALLSKERKQCCMWRKPESCAYQTCDWSVGAECIPLLHFLLLRRLCHYFILFPHVWQMILNASMLVVRAYILYDGDPAVFQCTAVCRSQHFNMFYTRAE